MARKSAVSDCSDKNNDPVEKLTCQISMLNVSIGRLEEIVKLSLSEQKRINENYQKDFEKHKAENRDDINNLWESIKKNRDGIWTLWVAFAAAGGLVVIAGATKMMGIW